MIKAIAFDLDGTLLPMNEDEFVKTYFGLLCKKLIPMGYNKDDLINTIWAGTNAMIKNDGLMSNEKIFWKVFAEKFGDNSLKDKHLFDEFYLNEFKQTKISCSTNPLATTAVKLAKQKGLKIILASRPVFPKVGMITRMNFVNLNENDFDYITSYENSYYTKPNPKYYEEFLNSNNLLPNEIIYFGNSETEDYIPATSIGIKTYLIDDEKGIKFDEVLNIIEKINL